jgi:hypothetical protein
VIDDEQLSACRTDAGVDLRIAGTCTNSFPEAGLIPALPNKRDVMNPSNAADALPEPTIRSHNQNGVGDVDIADPTKPLEVLIGPIDMYPKDRIDLYWGAYAEPVDSYLHSPDAPNTNGIFSLFVDTYWIKAGITDVRYTYTPFPSEKPETSESASVIVKLAIPGGRDPDPESPYQNESLLKPAVFPQGIITSPDGVSVTVAPYVNMEVGDKITVSWNGEFVLHRVESQDQVGQATVIPIPKYIIEMAGDSDRLEVRYEIRDIVNNWSRWSLPTFVEVEAGNSSLAAPITPQAPNGVLDLDRLAGSPVQALVVAYPEMAAADEVTLVVERNTAEGMALEPFVVNSTVQTPSAFVEFFVPFEQFLPITQGRARLKYTVQKATGMVQRSKSLSVTVVGQVQELQAPSVPAAPNGVLDPTTEHVVALVPPYYFMADGNDVTLVWSGKTAGGANVLHEELKTLNRDDLGKELNYSIPPEKVSVLAGGSVQVHYTVNTFARAFFKSPVLELTVSHDTSTPLPVPGVDQVSADGVLDPANIGLEAVVRIRPYPGMAIRDKVTLHWDGRLPDGIYSTYTVLNSGTVGREVVFRVLKSIVLASLDSQVNVRYEVERNGQIYRSRQLAFVVQQTMVTPLPGPLVKEAKGDTLYVADTTNGATVVIQATASFKRNDRVVIDVRGPNGSDSKEKTILEDDVGKELSLVFASALVAANVGQTIEVAYIVRRASGIVQVSSSLRLNVMGSLTELAPPLMDGVGANGVLVPSRVPESGATVRVAYQDMQASDSVTVSWRGTSAYDPPSQIVGGAPQLQFTLPKSFITSNAGQPATVTYAVTRAGTSSVSAPLQLTVSPALLFDASPVTLFGKVYLIPGLPDVLPAFPANTTVRRVASGGQAPYAYRSSNASVAVVDATGLASVRGNGTAVISVTDALGATGSYTVSVTGVIHCQGVGSGSLSQMMAAAASAGGRIPSLNELNEIYNAYGNRWPMGNANYWSTTVAAQNLVGMKWYFVKNLVTGADFKLLHHNSSLGVAIR